MLDRYAARWGLTLGQVLPGGRLSACVAAGAGDGGEVVLKVPTRAAAGRAELVALRRWEGLPVPRIVHADARAGVFAMTRIRPGTPADADDAEAAAALLRRLHAVAPTSRERPARLDAMLGDRLRRAAQRRALPENEAGRRLHARASTLLARPRRPYEPRLLHGDFQAKNLLRGPGGEPYAIDPLPCLGDPAFDAASWCVLTPSRAPIAERVEAIAAAYAGDPAAVAAWAELLCALEYRPYRPGQAARILAYVG